MAKEKPVSLGVEKFNVSTSNEDQKITVVDAISGNAVRAPHKGFLSDATYQQRGADLVLSDASGIQLTIKNYFGVLVKPDLISPDGGQVVSSELVNSFFLATPSIQYAQIGNAASTSSAEPIGVVQELKGTVFAVRTDGTRVELKKGDNVFQGDVIETEKESAANMLLADKTTFAIGDEARLALDEMVYNPATKEGQSQFSILKGVFVFASGEIAKTDSSKMTVTTPVATIGIRGTEVSGNISEEGAQITVLDGTVTVSTNAGTTTLGAQGETTSISDINSAPSQTFTLSPAQLQKAYGSVASVSTGTRLNTSTSNSNNTTESGDAGDASGEQSGDGGSDDNSGGSENSQKEGKTDSDEKGKAEKEAKGEAELKEQGEVGPKEPGKLGDSGKGEAGFLSKGKPGLPGEGQANNPGQGEPGRATSDPNDASSPGRPALPPASLPPRASDPSPSPPPPKPPKSSDPPDDGDSGDGDTGRITVTPTGGGTYDYTTNSTGVNFTSSDNENYTVKTGSGQDIITTGSGRDTVEGGSGNDTITTGNGNDTIHGGDGIDKIDAGGGNDSVNYSAGDSSSGNTVDGGSGKDTLVIDGNINAVDLGEETFASVYKNFEWVELKGSNQTLTVDAADINGSVIGGTVLKVDATNRKTSGLAIESEDSWISTGTASGFETLTSNSATLVVDTAININSIKTNRYSFDGGGSDDSWFTAANWDNDVAPKTSGSTIDITNIASTTNVLFDGGIGSNANSVTVSAISGSEGLSLTSGQLLVDSNSTLGGTISINGGQLGPNSGDTLTLTGPVALTQGTLGHQGTVTLSNTLSLSANADATIVGAQFNSSGPISLVNSATLDIQSDTFTNTGTLDITGSTLTINDSAGTLTNNTTINFNSDSDNSSVFNGALINSASQTITVSDDTTFNLHGADNANNGTMIFNTSDSTIELNGGEFTNNNSIAIDGVTVMVQSDTAGATFTNSSGQTISGTGTLNTTDTDVTLINNGVISAGQSPGILSFAGNFINGESAISDIEIGGSKPGSEHDKVVVNGDLHLDGTLQVLEYGGFKVGIGDSFNIFEANNISGSFSKVVGFNLSDDVILDMDQNDNSVLLRGKAVTLHGTSDNDNLIGSEKDDVIKGGAGRDTIISHGGQDIIFGEAGDDTFELQELGFSRIDGGTGTDTLYFTGEAQVFNLTNLRSDQIQSIEHIDLSALDSATLTLGNDDLNGLVGGMNNLTGKENSLVISGQKGHHVDIAGDWSNTGTTSINGSSYSIYQKDTGVEVAIAQGVSFA